MEYLLGSCWDSEKLGVGHCAECKILSHHLVWYHIPGRSRGSSSTESERFLMKPKPAVIVSTDTSAIIYSVAKKKLPSYLKKYFWDADFTQLDYERYPRYVLERILELGDEKAVRWMIHNFPQTQIIEALSQSRNLSPKSANFWSLLFQVPPERIRCLRPQFQKTCKTIWPY